VAVGDVPGALDPVPFLRDRGRDREKATAKIPNDPQRLSLCPFAKIGRL
jgi:hypothetical protein